MEARIMKMTAAAAVIMICAVAIVGVSYAYTASTQNSGNNATSEYVTLSQDGAGAYQFANNLRVYYSTVNTGSGTYTYSLAGGSDLEYDSAHYTAVKLGNDFTINANAVGRTGADLNCTFTTTNFDVDAEYCFFIVMTGTDSGTRTFKCTADNTWDSSSFVINFSTVYDAVTVKVYYAHLTSTLPTTAPVATPLNNATITFTASSEGSNPGLMLNAYATSIAVGETFALTVTSTDGSISTVAWSTGNDNATLAPTNEATTTITGATAGTCLVTATVTTSTEHTYSITCLVTVTAAPEP